MYPPLYTAHAFDATMTAPTCKLRTAFPACAALPQLLPGATCRQPSVPLFDARTSATTLHTRCYGGHGRHGMAGGPARAPFAGRAASGRCLPPHLPPSSCLLPHYIFTCADRRTCAGKDGGTCTFYLSFSPYLPASNIPPHCSNLILYHPSHTSHATLTPLVPSPLQHTPSHFLCCGGAACTLSLTCHLYRLHGTRTPFARCPHLVVPWRTCPAPHAAPLPTTTPHLPPRTCTTPRCCCTARRTPLKHALPTGISPCHLCHFVQGLFPTCLSETACVPRTDAPRLCAQDCQDTSIAYRQYTPAEAISRAFPRR